MFFSREILFHFFLDIAGKIGEVFAHQPVIDILLTADHNIRLLEFPC